jgi:hypothetical protein
LLGQIDALRSAVLQQIKLTSVKLSHAESDDVNEMVVVAASLNVVPAPTSMGLDVQALKTRPEAVEPAEEPQPLPPLPDSLLSFDLSSISLDNFEAALAKALDLNVASPHLDQLDSSRPLHLALPTDSSAIRPLRIDSNRSASTPYVPSVSVVAGASSAIVTDALLGEELEALLNSGATLEEVTNRLAEEFRPPSTSSVSPTHFGPYSSLPFFQSSFAEGPSEAAQAHFEPYAAPTHIPATTSPIRRRDGTTALVSPSIQRYVADKPVFALPGLSSPGSRSKRTSSRNTVLKSEKSSRKPALTISNSPSSSNQHVYPSQSKHKTRATQGAHLEDRDFLQNVSAKWDPILGKIVLTEKP